ncbi:unnamed protein product [Polarella glacialis]|uniref:FHA domain-containing protein n=1 Tax=Polarella glacialis TaxID=89957 RepID=A0A813LEC8_POLGL|nr:unnamed protein product [Polarella glacialis]
MVRQLVFLHEECEPFKLPREGVVTIGRRGNNDLVLSDLAVSGQHCTIELRGNLLPEVADTSSNGTSVNDVKLSKGQKLEVHDGDILSLTKPHPPGTGDGAVDPPPPRVQFRLEFKPGIESPTLAGTPQDPPSQTEGRTDEESQPRAPPRRGATTAEGFAHDLLLQEQQCKAKITGELLLARRRLDEERSRSEMLSRDLRRAKGTLEEEHTRRAGAQRARDSLRSEASKLKTDRQTLQDLRFAQATLQEKHEGAEVELTTQAQREKGLEGAVERLQEEMRQLQATSTSAEELAAAQERLRELQEEADDQALLAGEVERAELADRGAQEQLCQARHEIEALEQRAAGSRREAEAERAAAGQARADEEAAQTAAEQLREAADRFAESLRLCVDRWAHGLPERWGPFWARLLHEVEVRKRKKRKKLFLLLLRSQVSAPGEVSRAADEDSLAAACDEGNDPNADSQEIDESLGLRTVPLRCASEINSTPGSPQEEDSPAAADQKVPSLPLPQSQEDLERPVPQRLWSINVLGGTAAQESVGDGSLDEEDVGKGLSPPSKRQRS